MGRPLKLAVLVLAAASVTLTGQSVQPTPIFYFTEPALSPDRTQIAFVSGGDIWTVAAEGGQARLLVSDPATESRPFYSPDGDRLAFVSNRDGNAELYVLTLTSGQLNRLTFDDGAEQLDGWSRDGRWIYYSSPSRFLRTGMSASTSRRRRPMDVRWRSPPVGTWSASGGAKVTATSTSLRSG
jgi:tricorn protease